MITKELDLTTRSIVLYYYIVLLDNGVELTRRNRLDNVGDRENKYRCAFFKKSVGIRSESDRMLGQFDRILSISDSEAGVKEKKSGCVVGGEDECGDHVVGL